MGLLDAFLGGAGDYSPDQQGVTANLLYRAMRDKKLEERYAADQAQKIKDANLKVFQNDAIRGFEFTNAAIQNDFHKQLVKPAMDEWTQTYTKANEQGRRITAEEIGRVKMQQEGLKNKKAQADELIANMNKAAKIMEEDKYGVYPQGYGADLLATIPRLEDGSIDWDKLDPKAPLKAIGSPESMSLDGLMKKFHDTLEDGAMTEIETEWESGELYRKRNVLEFKGAVQLDENGKPMIDEEGRVIPLVNNQTMAVVKRTMPDLYAKLEAESQATGKGMQEILREGLTVIGGVKYKEAAATRITPDKEKETKPTKEERQATGRFEMIRGIIGFGREPDASMAGALKQAFGGNIEDVKVIENPGGKAPKVMNRPPAPGEDIMEEVGYDKQLKITYFQTTKDEYGEEKREKKTAFLDLKDLTDSKESILRLNNLINKITGQKVSPENIIQQMEAFTSGGEDEGFLDDIIG